MPGTDPRPPSATQSPPPAVVREGGRTLPSPALAEARRTMEICNACRYCESFCPVFPAMELRRAFSDGDLGYLANLCHNCKGCWHACQYAPPHEWGLNLPRACAELRAETYASHAWPRGLGRLFERNGMVVSLATALCLAAVMIRTVLLQDQATLSASHGGPGALYAVIPWGVMAGLGGLTFGWAVLAFALFIGAVMLLGFLLASMLLLVVMLILTGYWQRSWVSLMVAIVLPLVLYLFFSSALNTRFPTGSLLRALGV